MAGRETLEMIGSKSAGVDDDERLMIQLPLPPEPSCRAFKLSLTTPRFTFDTTRTHPAFNSATRWFSRKKRAEPGRKGGSGNRENGDGGGIVADLVEIWRCVNVDCTTSHSDDIWYLDFQPPPTPTPCGPELICPGGSR